MQPQTTDKRMDPEKPSITKRHLIFGWIAVGIVIIIASLWAYWGGVENFHEGWYSQGVWENISMMIVQYWSLSLIFIIIGIIGIRFPIASLPICIAIGIAASIILSGANPSLLWAMIIVPLTGLGLLFFFGRAKPRKFAYILAVALPIAILLTTSVIWLIKVSKKVYTRSMEMGPDYLSFRAVRACIENNAD